MTYDPTQMPGEVERLRVQASLPGELAAMSMVGLPERGHILDVGCGPGFFGANVRDFEPGLIITGVDVVDFSAFSPIGFEHADAYNLPFKDESVDGAYARLMLRHTGLPEDIVAEMMRVVRPGGWIGLLDSNDLSLSVNVRDMGIPEETWHAIRRGRHDWFRQNGGNGSPLHNANHLTANFVHLRRKYVLLTTGNLGRARFYDLVLQPWVDAANGVGGQFASFKDEWLKGSEPAEISMTAIGGIRCPKCPECGDFDCGPCGCGSGRPSCNCPNGA